MFYLGSSAGSDVAMVASFDNTVIPQVLVASTYSVACSTNITFGYSIQDPDVWEGASLPLWAPLTNNGTIDPNGGCNEFPANTPDLSKLIVLFALT